MYSPPNGYGFSGGGMFGMPRQFMQQMQQRQQMAPRGYSMGGMFAAPAAMRSTMPMQETGGGDYYNAPAPTMTPQPSYMQPQASPGAMNRFSDSIASFGMPQAQPKMSAQSYQPQMERGLVMSEGPQAGSSQGSQLGGAYTDANQAAYYAAIGQPNPNAPSMEKVYTPPPGPGQPPPFIPPGPTPGNPNPTPYTPPYTPPNPNAPSGPNTSNPGVTPLNKSPLPGPLPPKPTSAMQPGQYDWGWDNQRNQWMPAWTPEARQFVIQNAYGAGVPASWLTQSVRDAEWTDPNFMATIGRLSGNKFGG